MTRGRYLLAAQKYRCSYTCTSCGQANREYGFVRSADPVRMNSFTDNLGDEYHLSGEIATEKARRKFYRLQARVNGRYWYNGLRVSGKCKKCGRRQLWSPAFRHSAAALLSCLALAAQLWLHGVPESINEALLLTGVTAGSALLGEISILLAAHLWANRQNEDDLPWLEAIHKKAE